MSGGRSPRAPPLQWLGRLQRPGNVVDVVDIGKSHNFTSKNLDDFTNEDVEILGLQLREWRPICPIFLKSEHDQHISTLGKCFEMSDDLNPNLQLFPTWMTMHVGEKQIGDRATDALVVQNGKRQKMSRSPVLFQSFDFWEGWTSSGLEHSVLQAHF